MGESEVKRCLCYGLPILFVVLFFASFIFWIVQSMHLFIPVIPKYDDLRCENIEGGERSALEEYTKERQVSNDSIETTVCRDIRRRQFMPTLIPSFLYVNYNVLYVRHVKQDYEMVETALAMLYNPMQFYCFPIDSAASDSFVHLMRFLSQCNHNVIVPEGTFNGSDSVELFKGHEACFNTLHGLAWQHTAIIPENDIPLRTRAHITSYMEGLGRRSTVDGETTDNVWRAASLFLAWFSHQSAPVYLSRSMAPSIYQLLINNQSSIVPQRATAERKERKCTSNRFDEYGECIFTMENLSTYASSNALFARVDPSFDFGFVRCVHLVLFNDTYLPVIK